MTLLSALEDLQRTTLKAVAGYLRRLEYLSGLRNREGGYAHWGLGRVYGELAAKRALAQAHRAALSKVLSTPIRELVKDARESSELDGVPPAAYVEKLSARTAELLPPEPGAGSARHLSSVLHALSSLLRNQKPDATPPNE
jgi:hypothetical protein